MAEKGANNNGAGENKTPAPTNKPDTDVLTGEYAGRCQYGAVSMPVYKLGDGIENPPVGDTVRVKVGGLTVVGVVKAHVVKQGIAVDTTLAAT